MPTISEFFGILIRMYYDDHNPPHFHAYYGAFEAIITIDTLEVLEGTYPGVPKLLLSNGQPNTALNLRKIGAWPKCIVR